MRRCTVWLLTVLVIVAGCSAHDVTDESVKGQLGCTLCKLMAATFRKVMQAKPTIACVSWVVREVCAAMKIESRDVCTGAVLQYRDDLMYIAAEGYANDNIICGGLLKVCPYTPKDTNWTLTIDGNKPPVKPWTVVKPSAPTLSILHLADIHIDLGYVEGAESLCDEPLCCRTPPAVSGGSVKQPAGKWGMGVGYACDLPLKTVRNAFAHIASTHKPDMILWTGDIESHNVWMYNRTGNLNLISNMTQLFLEYFPNVPVIASIGNHESVPCNDIPVNGVPSKFSHDWLYTALEESWSHWLPGDTSASIKYRASYMVNPFKGLRILSLNTIYAYTDNFFLYISDRDPDGTLTWLIEQLAEAERVGDKVWIIGHIPNGDANTRPAWSRNFYSIVNRYESTIRGQFYGHTHEDSFGVFYKDFISSEARQTPTSFYFVSPSLTTFAGGHGVNPAYRMYTVQGVYDQSDFSVIDATTYSMDMAKANIAGNMPEWKIEYSARDAYAMANLHPQDWQDLLTKMATNGDYIDKYWQYFYRSAKGKNCGAGCKTETICKLGSAYSPYNTACAKSSAAQGQHLAHTEEQLTSMMKIVSSFHNNLSNSRICQV